jgi:hypothetical protein
MEDEKQPYQGAITEISPTRVNKFDISTNNNCRRDPSADMSYNLGGERPRS